MEQNVFQIIGFQKVPQGWQLTETENETIFEHLVMDRIHGTVLYIISINGIVCNYESAYFRDFENPNFIKYRIKDALSAYKSHLNSLQK